MGLEWEFCKIHYINFFFPEHHKLEYNHQLLENSNNNNNKKPSIINQVILCGASKFKEVVGGIL